MSAMSKTPRRSEFVTASRRDVFEETKCPDRVYERGGMMANRVTSLLGIWLRLLGSNQRPTD